MTLDFDTELKCLNIQKLIARKINLALRAEGDDEVTSPNGNSIWHYLKVHAKFGKGVRVCVLIINFCTSEPYMCFIFIFYLWLIQGMFRMFKAPLMMVLSWLDTGSKKGPGDAIFLGTWGIGDTQAALGSDRSLYHHTWWCLRTSRAVPAMVGVICNAGNQS